jgi:hypothetical protein
MMGMGMTGGGGLRFQIIQSFHNSGAPAIQVVEEEAAS